MKNNKKIFSGFFLVVLILAMLNITSAFPITGRVIEISPTETTIEDVACSIPACVGAYKTGEYYSDGCPIFKCPEQEIACTKPICKDGEKPYFTGEYDKYGCKIMKCAQEESYCCSSFDESEGKTKTFWSNDKNCGIPAGVSCPGSCPSVVDNSKCEIACSMPICKDGEEPYFTGKTDANGCKIYTCPAVACAMPICKDGEKPYFTGEYDKYGCKIYRCYEFDCPENCVCTGKVVTCPTTEEKPIEVEISTSEGSSSISVEKIAEDSILIKEGSTSVKTSKKLVIEEKKLLMETSQGNKEVKVMPSTASETAINQLKLKNYEIELKDVGKPVYEITGKKDVKVIGFINAEMAVKSQINAETGAIEKTEKPWWSFLAKE